MSVELRQYQKDIINKTRELMVQGKRSILIQSPTGSGKTLLTAHMLATAAKKGMHSWFVVHRRELINQSIRAFNSVGIRAGIVANGFLEAKKMPVQICSIQTLAKRHQRFPDPKLIVWDEAHHLGAASWSRIYKEKPRAFHIGLTATPQRLDGRGLGEWFHEMIEGPPVSWLIENGFLAPYKLYAPIGINIAGIATRMGDFAQGALAKVADKPTITGDAINHYQKHANGKRAVVFCVSIEHSKHVVEQFLKVGIPAAHVDGETEVSERDKSIKMFQAGDIRVISNVELFGEGFDLPAIEVGILLRPTQSLGLYLQQVGRVLRPSPGKLGAIILDHAGNCERHGLPDDIREWSLEGVGKKKGKAGENGPSVRVCPKCFAAQFPGSTECKFCHFVFAIDSRKVQEEEGELVEVSVVEMRRKRAEEQKEAKSPEDLIELGKRRGYKNPIGWANHVFDARNRWRAKYG